MDSINFVKELAEANEVLLGRLYEETIQPDEEHH